MYVSYRRRLAQLAVAVYERKLLAVDGLISANFGGFAVLRHPLIDRPHIGLFLPSHCIDFGHAHCRVLVYAQINAK